MTARRQLMCVSGKKSVVIEFGLDNSVLFTLSNGTLIASDGPDGWDIGDIGSHYDLEYNYPNLYFGYHACYADGKLWNLSEPLRLGSSPRKIKEVKLLETGRENVALAHNNGECFIVWTDTSVEVTDNAGSSERYVIEICFE